MNEQLGIDLGTTTSAACDCTYESDRVQGEQKYVYFNDQPYDRTAVLVTGTLINGFGEKVLNEEEEFGWDAWLSTGKYPLLEANFKMDLLSEDPRKREKAMQLTKKYFCHLYRKYTENKVRKKGNTPEKVTTVVTYPAKFPVELQQFLKKAAEEAGFVNVHLINEAQAAMQYALSFDSEETARFFQNNKKRVLKIMLIDMGAGTTDIAVFEYDTMDPSRFTPIAFYPKQGGHNFGGGEIDDALYGFYVSRLGADYPENYSEDGDAVLGERLLREHIKQHKEQRFSGLLKNNETAPAPMDLMRDARKSPQKPDLRLNREGFEALLKDYLPQFPALVNGALEEAKLSGEEIDLILLTGGHSPWYFVKEMLLNRMGFQTREPKHQVKLKLTEDQILTFPQPHLVVAKGAAVVDPKKKRLLAPVRQGSFYGNIDLNGKIVTPCCWEEMAWWHEGQAILPTGRYPMYWEGLSRVKRDGKWGCINQTGMLVIPCQWDAIERCFEGLVSVKKDGKWGFIDKTGRVVIPCQWDEAKFFSEGLACVKKDGKWGYIDKTGKVIIPCQWDGAWRFIEGLGMVKKGTKWGYIDQTGRIVIPCQWDSIMYFQEGLAEVKKDGKCGLIDQSGKIVVPCQWDGISHIIEEQILVRKGEKQGVIDKTGRIISHCQWDEVWHFSEGLAAVKKDGKWGYIDKTGKVIIPCQWDDARRFIEGLDTVKKGTKWGYIDKTGRIAIPCQWDEASSFREGLAAVKKNGKWGYIDQNGSIIVPCQWDAFDYDYYHSGFNDGLAKVKKDGKWGYIDKTGSIIIACQWDEIGRFPEGLFRVKKDGKWGYIDKTGNVVIPCQWDEIGRFELVE